MGHEDEEEEEEEEDEEEDEDEEEVRPWCGRWAGRNHPIFSPGMHRSGRCGQDAPCALLLYIPRSVMMSAFQVLGYTPTACSWSSTRHTSTSSRKEYV